MRSRSLATTTAAMLVVGVVLALGPAANAAATRFVGTNPIGNGTNCTHPGYNSIQAAVTAANPGNKIVVCPGTYQEQVVVTKNLKIQGSGTGSTFVQIPSSRVASACNPTYLGVDQQDIFDVCGGATVTISAMTIQGPWGPYPFNDCSVAPTGIAVMGGATLHLMNAVVTDIRQDSTGTGGINGCQGGVGVRIGRLGTTQVGHASITNTLVSAYQKGGVVVSYTGSTLTLSKSTIQGVGATEAIAQNGLQVNDGARATVTKTTIKGNECDDTIAGCGSDLMNNIQSFGVLLLDPAFGTSIASSTIRDNDAGLYNDDTIGVNKSVTSTSFLNNRYGGITLDEGPITMQTDTISGSPTGVEVLSYNGQSLAAYDSLTTSTISGATTAVVLEDDGSVGYPQASLTLTRDDLSANGYGVDNTDGSAVNAIKNYWGGAHGPSDWSFGSGVGVSANVDFFPWFNQAALTSQSTCNFMGNVNVTAAAFGIYCGNANNNIITLNGANGPTLTIGNGGNDTMTASGGGDAYFIGGTGNDSFTGGPGANDHAQGRGGSDTFSGVEFTSP